MLEWDTLSLSSSEDIPRIVKTLRNKTPSNEGISNFPYIDLTEIDTDISTNRRVFLLLERGKKRKIEGIIELIQARTHVGLYFSRYLPAGGRGVTKHIPIILQDVPGCMEVAFPMSNMDPWLYGNLYRRQQYMTDQGAPITLVAHSIDERSVVSENHHHPEHR